MLTVRIESYRIDILRWTVDVCTAQCTGPGCQRKPACGLGFLHTTYIQFVCRSMGTAITVLLNSTRSSTLTCFRIRRIINDRVSDSRLPSDEITLDYTVCVTHRLE